MALKSYPIKYLIFFLPFMVAICLELFVLPVHQFTFRVWESLAVKRSFGILKGQFYPNMKVQKNEEGDLAFYTHCAIQKDVVWITDLYGYRKVTGITKHFPIVIVGDSNIAGSSLSQEELLSEVLEKKLGKSVYPLAGERLRALFQHDLLKKNLPAIVILASIERDIPDGLSPLKPGDLRSPSRIDRIVEAIRFNPVIQRIAIGADRIFKGNMLNYFRARINGSGPSLRRVGSSKECPIFFLQGVTANRNSSTNRIDSTAKRLKDYSDFLKKRGIRFIFLPIPNKETILYEYLKMEKPDFLQRLTQRLREINIEVIDTQKVFDEVYTKTHSMPYHPDDTHWNALGVTIAAEMIAEQIKKKPVSTSR
jgi:hypothetical protein